MGGRAEMLAVLPKQELIGHSGDVIANYKMTGDMLRRMFLRFGQRAAPVQIKGKQLGQAGHGASGIFGDERMVVDMREEESFQLGVLCAGGFAESRHAGGSAADVVRGLRAGLQEQSFGAGDEVADEMIDYVAQGFIEFQARAGARVSRFDRGEVFREEGNFVAEGVQIEKIGLEGIVEVGRIVGDFIHPIDELRFERRAEVEQIVRQFGIFGQRIIAGMFDDAFADFEGEIEAIEADVTMLEMLDDAESVEVVVKTAAVGAHEFVELALAGMAEGRMTDVVDQGESFDEFGVQAERGGNGAGDLGHFESVGEAVAEMIGEAGAEDLGFRFEAAEGAGMDDPVTIAGVFTAIGMRGFGKAAASGGRGVHSPGSESAKRFDNRNLRGSGGSRANQDCGASMPRPRSASSATLVFG